MRFLPIAFLCLASASLAQAPDSGFLKKSSFEEIPALLLSNDKIELTVLTSGGALANLILRDDPGKLSPFWNPKRYARETGKKHTGTGIGHFVCVDGFGPVSPEEKEAGLPGHGEAHALPWETKFSRKEGAAGVLTQTVKLPILQEITGRVDTMDVLYWLGHAAVKSGELDLAIAQFKTMLERNPDLLQVRLELANAYLGKGDAVAATAELDKVLAANPPKDLRAQIELVKTNIALSNKRLFATIRASTGFQYDDNVNAGPTDSTITVPGGGGTGVNIDNWSADPENPYNYSRDGDFYYNYAAKFGSVAVPAGNTKWVGDGGYPNGLNTIGYVENGNEEDAWWTDYYWTPMDYFALSSADYDGHETRLGRGRGLKNADSNAQLLMSGLVQLDTNRVRTLKFLCEQLRTDRKFIWEAGVQYHYYCSDSKSISQQATRGISPEEDHLREKLARVKAFQDRLLPGVPVILGENGYDRNQGSRQRTPVLPGQSPRASTSWPPGSPRRTWTTRLATRAPR